jgi:hypothetical protein
MFPSVLTLRFVSRATPPIIACSKETQVELNPETVQMHVPVGASRTAQYFSYRSPATANVKP